MGSTENFCLRWNDFEANVSGSFRQLREESDFFDVTIACDDAYGRPLKAHKVILSACSNFFKQMLRTMAIASPGHPNPLIYLRGIKYSDMQSILDFMYQGEVNISQDDLNTFLAVAEDLQIKGLTQQSSKDLGKKDNVKRSSTSAPGPVTKRVKKGKISTASLSDDADEMSHTPDREVLVAVKNEPTGFDIAPSTSAEDLEVAEGNFTATRGKSAVKADSSNGEGASGYDEFEDTVGFGEGEADDSLVDQGVDGGGENTREFRNVHAIPLEDGRGKCAICEKVFKCFRYTKMHIEIKHQPQSRIQCTMCQKVSKNVYSFRNHVQLMHNITGVQNVVETYGHKIEDDEH